MRRTSLVGLTALFLLVVGVACEEQPCDEYIDYMCACHDGDDGQSCDDYVRIYTDAEPDVQDQCALDLEDQEDLDLANGHECQTGGDTGL